MKTIYKVLLIVVFFLWAITGSHFILYAKNDKYHNKFNEIFNKEEQEDHYSEYLSLLAELTSYYDIYWESIQDVTLLDEDDLNREPMIKTINDCVIEYNKITSKNPKLLKHEMFLHYLPIQLSSFEQYTESELFDYLAYKVRYIYYSYMGLYEEYRLNTIEDFMIEYLIQQKEEYNNLLERYNNFVLSDKFPPGFPTKIRDEIIPVNNLNYMSIENY